MYFSIVNSPSFLDIIENSIRIFIRLIRLYCFGIYAIFISERAFKNFSSPNPIIIAAKVPPKTTINGATRKRALNDPPSIKNAPKIETKPSASPANVPGIFFIDNQGEILEETLPTFYTKAAADNRNSEVP